MSKAKFAIFWVALFLVLFAFVTCFAAWGIPDFGAWKWHDRMFALLITAMIAGWWGMVGLMIWEARQ